MGTLTRCASCRMGVSESPQRGKGVGDVTNVITRDRRYQSESPQRGKGVGDVVIDAVRKYGAEGLNPLSGARELGTNASVGIGENFLNVSESPQRGKGVGDTPIPVTLKVRIISLNPLSGARELGTALALFDGGALVCLNPLSGARELGTDAAQRGSGGVGV